MKKIFRKKIPELYTQKNPQKLTEFEGVIRFLIRQKNKKLFEKNEIFANFTYGGQYCPTHRIHVGVVLDGFNDLYINEFNNGLVKH